jgi:hypothetical protein
MYAGLVENLPSVKMNQICYFPVAEKRRLPAITHPQNAIFKGIFL